MDVKLLGLFLIGALFIAGCVTTPDGRPAPEGVQVTSSPASPTPSGSSNGNAQVQTRSALRVPLNNDGSPTLAQSTVQVQGQALVEFRDEQNGYRIMKPGGWQADIYEDAYLLVSRDADTDVLVWPIKLQGQYKSMTGEGLGNYLIGLIKQQFTDFTPESISVSPDKSSMQVIATVSVEGTKLKVQMSTFVDENGNGILSGYEAREEEFIALEPLLRSIATSYQPIVTSATKAAVGPAPTQPSGFGGVTGVQLVPFTSGDGAFSFQSPAGWKVESLGQCSTKSMAAYDPQNPVRRVFAIASNTYSLPVDGATAEGVATGGLPALSQYVPAFGTMTNVQVTAGTRQAYPATQGVPGIVDAAVFEVTMTIDGKPARGRVGTYLLDPSGGYFGSSGVYYLSLAGSFAEPEAFDSLIGVVDPLESRGPLGKSVGTFEISQSYANACTASGQADISARTGDISRTLSETSDIITGGYNERSQVTDRVAQKWSDTTLGVDRVYNPDRDEVYQVPNNFYDAYDINRQKFEQQNLQPLTPEQWNTYAPLDGALNIR
ncbi:hypothetical protein HY572_05335 [Candidatus Micrarchaeota archaeon]|nr:hypothetical protein [Candidatus Micrarchaeota archaeon]